MSQAMHRLALALVVLALLPAFPSALGQQTPPPVELTLLRADSVVSPGHRGLFEVEVRNAADRNVTLALTPNESTGAMPVEVDPFGFFTLGPREATRVTVVVAPNESVPYGEYALRLEAREAFVPSFETAHLSWTVRVAEPPAWRIEVNGTAGSTPPGDTAVLDVRLANDGAERVSLVLDAREASGALSPQLDETHVTVEAGAPRGVALRVPIPPEASGGWYSITVSATRTDGDGRTLRATTFVTVGPRLPTDAPRPVEPVPTSERPVNASVTLVDASLVARPPEPLRVRVLVENLDDDGHGGTLTYRVAEASGRAGLVTPRIQTLHVPPRDTLVQDVTLAFAPGTPGGNYTLRFLFWPTANGSTELEIPVRVEPALRPLPPLVAARVDPMPVQVPAGGRADALLTLRALGATDGMMIRLRGHEDPRGFRLEFPQDRVLLAAGLDQTVRVVVHAPADAPVGQGLDLRYDLLVEAAEPRPPQSESVRVRVTEAAPAPPTPLETMAAFAREHPVATGGAVAFAGVAGVGVALARREWWRYLMVAPLLPLYTRLQKREVLEHKTRERIHQMILDRPGIHYSALKDETKLNAGALVHHLRTLERHGLVASRREGVLRCFYPTGARLPPAPAVPLTPTQQRIVEMLAAEPLTQRELASRLGLTQQGASYHLKTLERKGLLHLERDGPEWRYHRLHDLAPDDPVIGRTRA